MKYNIVQSLPVLQHDRVVMVEQANVSMFSKKIKPDESSQVYFSHWRTLPTCEETKIGKESYSVQKSLKRREISKIGSVKFYTYQPTKDSNRKTSRSVKQKKKTESKCTLSTPCCVSTTSATESAPTNNCNSSCILDTLNLSNTTPLILLNNTTQPHVKRSAVLSIKELLN
ncbi:predicted protein [Naegleria gruberi]|uniref:Predicted protein n=1 Tax=Naegleria gruberi TaxID=5762 RepID=D2W3J5_NAEGR|nr:uncharacterized protein NAEGRDRAFT_75963 [Naegleria gruberi]EFC36344.1 predicted protein [Naegleria gruberi]|eukprot:XP_002669088.1 predicted protein [Naegleria gruberi strain NEG-M]